MVERDKRRSKVDKHAYRGLLLGYTATEKNICYLDLDSGLVETSHDEAWFLHSSKLPAAAQMLFNLGYMDVTILMMMTVPLLHL